MEYYYFSLKSSHNIFDKYGISGRHTYPQTKTPHNFHLINQNGTIPNFPSIHKSKEPISIFYLKEK